MFIDLGKQKLYTRGFIAVVVRVCYGPDLGFIDVVSYSGDPKAPVFVAGLSGVSESEFVRFSQVAVGQGLFQSRFSFYAVSYAPLVLVFRSRSVYCLVADVGVYLALVFGLAERVFFVISEIFLLFFYDCGFLELIRQTFLIKTVFNFIINF